MTHPPWKAATIYIATIWVRRARELGLLMIVWSTMRILKPVIGGGDTPKHAAAGEQRTRAHGRKLHRRLRRAWHSVIGLLTILDLLSKLGFWLYRGTMRRTMGVTVALGAVLVPGQQVNAGMTLKQALTGTGLILAMSCLGCLLLMVLRGPFWPAASSRSPRAKAATCLKT